MSISYMRLAFIFLLLLLLRLLPVLLFCLYRCRRRRRQPRAEPALRCPLSPGQLEAAAAALLMYEEMMFALKFLLFVL